MLYFQHSHIMLSNDFILVYTRQDLLYTPHSLFWVNYFFDKHH